MNLGRESLLKFQVVATHSDIKINFFRLSPSGASKITTLTNVCRKVDDAAAHEYKIHTISLKRPNKTKRSRNLDHVFAELFYKTSIIIPYPQFFKTNAAW